MRTNRTQRRLLEWLEREKDHTLLESQVANAGLSLALGELVRNGRVELTAKQVLGVSISVVVLKRQERPSA